MHILEIAIHTNAMIRNHTHHVSYVDLRRLEVLNNFILKVNKIVLINEKIRENR